MTEAERYKIPVRATRAYMAGFGTSGSLLAAAAALFLLGSAFVAFRGWPQITTGPATSTVAAVPAAFPSAASPRLTQALSAARLRASGRTTVASQGAAPRHRVAASFASRAIGGAPVGGSTTARGLAAGQGSSTGGCGGCNSPASNPVSYVTNAIGQNVSALGNNVGQQLTGLSGNAGHQLSASSPQVGSAVGGTGSAVGSAVSGTATTAGNAVTGLGNSLTGGH